MKLHMGLARALKRLKVDTVFGVMGDANLFFADSFGRQENCTFVAACNEGGAVLMANGYAAVSGNVGVATVTHGPGVSNTVTALIESVRARRSLIVIAGDTAEADKDNLQNLPQHAIVSCTGAGFVRVAAANNAVHDLRVAWRRAQAERRPIVLDVPKNLMWEETEDLVFTEDERWDALGNPRAEDLDRAIGLIASCRRPLVLAGRGACGIDARTNILSFAERVDAPLMTTLGAKDLFRGEPFDMGFFGGLANEFGSGVIARSDCVVVFGASLNHLTTARGTLLANKRVVQCDVDSNAIGRLCRVDAGVVGDSSIIASTMVAWLDQGEIEKRAFRSSTEEIRGEAGEEDIGGSVDEDAVDFCNVLEQLNVILPCDRVLVVDAGRFMGEAVKKISVSSPNLYVHTANIASIGLGLASSVGSCFGAVTRPTVLIIGDGGFMLGGLSELSTAIRYKRDLIVVILNDRAYGGEYVQFVARSMDPSLSRFDWPDFAAVATALGAEAVSVRQIGDLSAVTRAVKGRTGVLLIDVRLDPDRIPDPAPY